MLTTCVSMSFKLHNILQLTLIYFILYDNINVYYITYNEYFRHLEYCAATADDISENTLNELNSPQCKKML